jgi:hypothetical protein
MASMASSGQWIGATALLLKFTFKPEAAPTAIASEAEQGESAAGA